MLISPIATDWDSLHQAISHQNYIEAQRKSFQKEADNIDAAREKIWQLRAEQPLEEVAKRLRETCTFFGESLRARQFDNAAAAVLAISRVIHDLEAINLNWHSAMDKWFAEQAKPFNEKGSEFNQRLGERLIFSFADGYCDPPGGVGFKPR